MGYRYSTSAQCVHTVCIQCVAPLDTVMRMGPPAGATPGCCGHFCAAYLQAVAWVVLSLCISHSVVHGVAETLCARAVVES